MKNSLITAIGILAFGAIVAIAGTVNPTSNVLGDTAATANTLVLRDGNGAIDGTQLTAGSVGTAVLISQIVDTGKIKIQAASVDSGKILCIVGGNTSRFGTCTAASIGSSVCNCN